MEKKKARTRESSLPEGFPIILPVKREIEALNPPVQETSVKKHKLNQEIPPLSTATVV